MTTRSAFTGRHMAVTLVAFFGVVIAVNVTMARYATSTFGGVVVENSYVASQHFSKWMEAGRRQRALGWDATVARNGDDLEIAAQRHGAPVVDARVTAVAAHPLGRLPERQLTFRQVAPGRYRALEAVPAGRWRMTLTVTAQGDSAHFVKELAQ